MPNRKLQDMLESDDELPLEYDEIPVLPAYQNDRRFEPIDFPWIDNKKLLEQCLPKVPNEVCTQHSTEDVTINLLTETFQKRTESANRKKLIKKGVLNKRDIFCIKCVATVSSDTTLIWFINFLMLKDIQSDYDFLKSCLVENYAIHTFPLEKQVCTDSRTHTYEITVNI